MIPEPQRAYVLELLLALGPATGGFVLAGAQAMKFWLPRARATRDFDFILDVMSLRPLDVSISQVLASLGYTPVPEARLFQFDKPIPDSVEVMRIEFMAPEEYQRGVRDFRVDIQEGVHARGCAAASIALRESDVRQLNGFLPSGAPASTTVRVIRPTALVLMKCLAMDDRYRNLRGPLHAEHDRNEARVHATDIVAVLSAQANLGEFRTSFLAQCPAGPLRDRVLRILTEYFGDENKPGSLLYEEFLRLESGPEEDDSRHELLHARRILSAFLGATPC
ncbi:MAG: nucleotidyl transferase AbiEii/AbiGii toxin family protein [Acidobacteriota bacterium]